MGYATIGYGVHLDELAHVRGSRNAALLAELQRTFADRLAHADQMNADLYNFPISLQEALRRIVMDELAGQSSREAAQYIYAYELLCERFGRPLDGRGHIKFLDDLGWNTALQEFRSPLNLSPAGPMPTTGYLTATEVQVEYQRFKDYNSDEGDDEPSLAAAREEFVWWLQQCADGELSLVAFCY